MFKRVSALIGILFVYLILYCVGTSYAYTSIGTGTWGSLRGDVNDNFTQVATDIAAKEDSLGNPASDGYVLSSTAAGVRSWIEMSGGSMSWPASDSVYYGAYNGAWVALTEVFQSPLVAGTDYQVPLVADTDYLTPSTAASTYEAALGNPSTDGYVLSSTAAGVRSWIAGESGGASDIAYDISTWDANTDAPTKNVIRDYMANFDADGDGDFTDETWFPSTSGAPTSASYLTATAEAGLSAEVNLGALTSGLLKITVDTGVATPATATAGTDYQAPITFGTGTEAALAYVPDTSGGFATYDNLLNPTFDTDYLLISGTEPDVTISVAASNTNWLSYLSIDDLISLTGITEGTANLGTFTGDTITDSSTIKSALQELETAVESAASGGLLETDIDTSAELLAIVTDGTGTGALVFAGGDIGAATATTPSASDDSTLVATTAFVQTELADYEPADSTILKDADIGSTVQAYDADLTTWAGVTPGTGITDALAINTGSAGAPVLYNGAGGTPSAITLTNGTGLPASGLNLDPTILSSTQTLSSFGGYYIVTGAYTITLPPVASGSWGCFQVEGTYAASVDPNASDLITLDGTALTDGTAIVSDGTTGNSICLQYRDANGWTSWGNNGWASE